jgi:hypothetical protein
METNILPVAANTNNILESHHLSEIFPELSATEQEELSADIKRNGILVPIVIYDGKILDGRARYKFSKKHGIECPTVTRENVDPIDHIISLNIQRRHLTKAQCAMVAARLATLPRGGQCSNLSIPTQTQAAKLMDVSRTAVQSAKDIIASGNSDIIAKVESGKMSVHEAYDACKKKQDEPKTQPTKEEHLRAELKKVVDAVNKFSIQGFDGTLIHVTIDAEIATLEALCERLRKINTPPAVDQETAAYNQKMLLETLKKKRKEKKHQDAAINEPVLTTEVPINPNLAA